MAERGDNKSKQDKGKQNKGDEAEAKAPEWIKVAEAGSQKQGWYKATRMLVLGNGILYQTTTEHRAPGSRGGHVTACSEALIFVPAS